MSSAAPVKITDELGNFQKTSDNTFLWCGLSVGMTKEKAVQALKRQPDATYKWIFNADDGTEVIDEGTDSTQIIFEEIDMKCQEYSWGRVDFENGKISFIMIFEFDLTAQEFIDFFGDPEQYFATSIARPMINETEMHYAFVYPTRGISFDGEYTNKEDAPVNLDLASPISSIFLENPEPFDAISTFYTQDTTDPRDYPRTFKDWSGRDSVEVENTTYKSF